MAGRTPREALNAFLGPLQLSLSCITDEVLQYRSYGNKDYPNTEPHSITINFGNSVGLLSDDGLALSFRMRYWIVEDPGTRGPWKAKTAEYNYSIEDDEQQEIIAYHWHPTAAGSVDFPHLHLGAGLGMSRKNLFRAHIPTGRIAIEDMIRLTIVDFSVEPLRKNWNDILTKNKDNFRDWRTWN